MRYAIIGTGAIGGYYGARLAQSGQEVHFLLRSDYEYVKQNGLQVDSCNGSFHLDHPYIYNSTREMPQCDVVFVCLKSINNHKLSELLPPLLHEHTLVVLIQNGIGVEADVQAMFPGLQLAAGLAFICSAKTERGRVNHQRYGQINLGNYSCRDEQRLQQVVDDFNAAGVKAGQVEYQEARWKKAVWNMPFNGMTVALNTRTDLLLKHPSTRRLIREQMMEVIGAAQHLGVKNIDETFADKMIQMDRRDDTLLAVDETRLRLPPQDGNRISLHTSHRHCATGRFPYAQARHARSRATVPGSTVKLSHKD